MNRLKIQRPDGADEDYTFQKPFSIGRRSTCEVHLDHQKVSRDHARIREVAERWVLEDLGSINGTELNGRRLARGEVAALSDGDSIKIHPFELRVTLPRTGPGEEATIMHAAGVGKKGANVAPPVDPPTVAPREAPPVVPPAPPRSPVLANLVPVHDVLAWSKGKTEVVVAEVIEETHDTRTFRLVGKSAQTFVYKPGQSIALTVEIEGKAVKRSYSISSSPSRPHAIELTIKRCPNGLVSNWMADNVARGHTLSIQGPYGSFSCFEHPAPKYFFLAAGSGITPLMSMIRWLTDTSAEVDIVLLYSVRSPADVIFGRELEYLAARHPSLRVVITATATRAGTQGWCGIASRVERGLMQLAAPDLLERELFMCGPAPFADAMLAEFEALGVPEDRVRREFFSPPAKKNAGAPAPKVEVPLPARTPPPVAPPPARHTTTLMPDYVERAPEPPAAPPKRAPKPAPPPRDSATPAPAGGAPGFRILYAASSHEVVADGAATLLQLARANNIDVQSGCEKGSCGTCAVLCKQGRVLSEGEEQDATGDDSLRICIAYPRSDVVLDA